MIYVFVKNRVTLWSNFPSDIYTVTLFIQCLNPVRKKKYIVTLRYQGVFKHIFRYRVTLYCSKEC